MARIKRYAIFFSLRGSYNPKTKKWTRGAWPILFASRDAAEFALYTLPVFANPKPKQLMWSKKNRIKSACVKLVYVRG